MQLSAKTQNACLAVLELASRHENPQPVCLKTIAEQQNISPQFLVQILLQLKRAGIVRSTRGASGGYRLAMEPNDVSLLDIVTAMEGAPSGRVDSPKATRAAEILYAAWSNLVDEHRQRLAAVTLASLCEAMESEANGMYYI